MSIELLKLSGATQSQQYEIGWNPIKKAKKAVKKAKKAAKKAKALYKKNKKLVDSTIKTAKKLNYKKADWDKVYKVAMVAGPVVAVAFPAAAPFVIAGMALATAVKNKDPAALLTKENLDLAASQGVPGASDALAAYETGQAVLRNEQATAVIQAAKGGDLESLAKLEEIKALREAGDPAAIQATSILQAARQGQEVTTQNAIAKKVVASQSLYDSAWS